MTTTSNAEAGRDTLVERLFGSALGALDLFCIYLGDQLGMYRALVDEGPSTSTELASLVGVNERYAREWLQQQAMAGILETQNSTASDAERRYAVPAGHDEVLLDVGSLNGMAPMAQIVVACALPIHAVLDAFRTGEGSPVRRLRRRPARGPGAVHAADVRQPTRYRLVPVGAGRPRSPQ